MCVTFPKQYHLVLRENNKKKGKNRDNNKKKDEKEEEEEDTVSIYFFFFSFFGSPLSCPANLISSVDLAPHPPQTRQEKKVRALYNACCSTSWSLQLR